MAMEICLRSVSIFRMLASDWAQNMIASHELSLYCTSITIIITIIYQNQIHHIYIDRYKSNMYGPYPEHDASDAEDDGDETGVIDGKILRGHHLRHEWLRRRWLTWIIRRIWVPVRRHFFSLFGSLSLSLEKSLSAELSEYIKVLPRHRNMDYVGPIFLWSSTKRLVI